MESGILCASGPELSILATTIAIYIGEIFDATDLNTIASFLNLLSDAVALLAVQKARCEEALKITSNTLTINSSSTQ